MFRRTGRGTLHRVDGVKTKRYRIYVYWGARNRALSLKAVKMKTKIIIFFIAVLIISAAPFSSLAKYHPEIKWREISAKPFIVVFPEGYEDIASYTLDTAQRLFENQMAFWGGDIRLQGPIRILLTDVYDIANGSATFFPYNRIELFLFNPPPDSTLGGYDEWVRMVLSHEITHIIHFNWGSGFTYFWRAIFGTNPLLYPTVVIPSWLLEGTAVYDETRVNRWGRLNTPDYYLMLNDLARAGKIRDWRQIWGDPTPWPGATSIYLYGAAFCRFLEQRYGEDKIPLLVRHYARHPVPIIFKKNKGPVILSFQQRFKEIFGKDINTLWQEFNGYLENIAGNASISPTIASPAKDSPAQAGPVRFLTASGKTKAYPVALDANRIVYAQSNYKEYPGIYMLDLKDGKSRRLAKAFNVTGLHYSHRDKTIYYSAMEYNRGYYRQSDIYTLAPHSGKKKRLSFGKRLSHPVTPPSGNNKSYNKSYNIIYCIKRIKMKSYLCRFNPLNGKEELISGGYDSLAFPAISPDGQHIAVSLKERGHNWRIGLFRLVRLDPNDGQNKATLVRMLTNGDVKSYYPRWRNHNRLYFIREHERGYRLAELEIDGRRPKAFVYSAPGTPSLKSFDFMSGDKSYTGNKPLLVASFYDDGGFNLGVTDIAKLERKSLSPVSTPVVSAAPPESRGDTAAADNRRVKKYNALRELLPKYIIPGYRKGGNEYQPGISIGGSDLTEKHSYSLDGYYGFSSEKAGGRFNYTFDGFFPSLSFTFSDLSGSYSTSHSLRYIHNEQKFQLSMLYPLSYRQRNQLYLFSDIHFETISDSVPSTGERFSYRINGMKLALLFNSAIRYYDSISDADGVQLSLSYSREFKFLGSDYRINTAALEFKHYLSLGRPNVLALRLAVTDSWGEARRLVYMGGSDSHGGFHVAGSDMFNLMRAYPSGYFTGTGGFLVNAEYRISLFKIENVFFIFRSLERVYLSLFADIGNLWRNKIKIDPSASLGMEFNVLTYLGEFKLNIAAGIAIGQWPYHKPLLYIRLGQAF